MKLFKIDSAPSMKDALDVIDGFRKDIETGKIVAFFTAAVGREDDTYAYVGSVKPVTQLRLLGAMSHALHMAHHDEV